jgi:DNA invertase Pin-like site-specific DNA recombinase
MVYGYLRVSTLEQDNEKFKSNILHYANEKDLGKVIFVEEKISGKKDWKTRELGILINKLNKDDVFIVPELSRLARSISQIYQIIDELKNKKVSLHIIKQKIVISGNMDMMTKMFISNLSLFAELERDFISQRTKEGLQATRERGVKLGKPKGHGLKLEGKEIEIIELLNKGLNVTNIARYFNVNRLTMIKFIKDKKLR